ncbi:chemotaxis protein CheW [Sphingomonas sp.]|uniref:chemotaxis protein CheW n=1 Tax=Sphingomonas sp. TaxID=28214 RepID=UPI002FCA04B0
MTELLLIVTLAGQRIALRASDVEAVVEIGALVPVPRAAAHVAGLAALRSKVLTVIDCHASLALEAPRPRRRRRHAIVTTVDGHNYALLIDQAEDVVEVALDIQPVRVRLSPGWRRVTWGMTEIDGAPLLLVDIQALLAAPGGPAADDARPDASARGAARAA